MSLVQGFSRGRWAVSNLLVGCAVVYGCASGETPEGGAGGGGRENAGGSAGTATRGGAGGRGGEVGSSGEAGEASDAGQGGTNATGGGSIATGGSGESHSAGAIGEAGAAGESGSSVGGTSNGGRGGTSGVGGGGGASGGASGAAANAGSGGTSATCESAGCPEHASCRVHEGATACACDPGFEGTGSPLVCADIDECLIDNGACDQATLCTNTLGGRVCGPCPAGTEGSGETGCRRTDCFRVSLGGNDAAAVASGGVTPFRNVESAIAYADMNRDVQVNVCVAADVGCGTATYAGPSGGPLTMRDGISVFGGYDPERWVRCESDVILAVDHPVAVRFGPDVQSSTALEGFVIRRLAAETTTAVLIEGARNVLLDSLGIDGVTNPIDSVGIDVSGGADVVMRDIRIPRTQIGIDQAIIASGDSVGIRTEASRITLSGATISLASSAGSARGIWLIDSAGSSIDHVVLSLDGAVDHYGVDVADSPGVSMVQSSLRSESSSGQTFGVRAVRSSLELQAALELRVSAGDPYGIWLEDSPGSRLSGSLSLFASGVARGVQMSGDGRDVDLGASVSVQGASATGILLADCLEAEPLVHSEVTAIATQRDASAVGISISGCAAQVIGSSVLASGPNASSTLGIGCSGACVINGNSVRTSNSRTGAGLLAGTGVQCGGCRTVLDNHIVGLQHSGCARACNSRATGLLIQGSTELVARNRIDAGCGDYAAGIDISQFAVARVENNIVSGGRACAGNDPMTISAGLVHRGGNLDVHSNTFYGGGSTDEPSPGLPYCRSFGVASAGGGTFRNNIMMPGICGGGRAAFTESLFEFASSGGYPPHGDPLVFENNDLVGTYANEASSSLTAAEVNALTDMITSGNFSADPLFVSAANGDYHLTTGSPCIDAGTSTAAPATDYASLPRTTPPDVGAYEWAAASDPCYQVDCSGHGVCNATLGCVCEAGYGHDDNVWTCADVDACLIQNGGCDPLTTCTDAVGTHSCGPCPEGFGGDGTTGCYDLNECETANGGCDADATCTNTVGSRTCACTYGFTGDGILCTDIDECAEANGGCDSLSSCTNTPGGRSCGPCPAGYAGSGDTGCEPELHCAAGRCEHGGTCVEVPGGFSCDCRDGFGGERCELGFTQVAVGSAAFACGLRTNGSVECWGENSVGQSRPPAGAFRTISAGDRHACGIRADFTLACWGMGSYGLTAVPAGTFKNVSSGSDRSCAVRTDGTVVCWGRDVVNVPPPPGVFDSVAVGSRHVCGLHPDGSLDCWGSNGSGEANEPGGSFRAVAVGYSHSCAIRSDDAVLCWGSNLRGESNAPAGSFRAIEATGDRTCALTTDGLATCWGDVSAQNSPTGETFDSISVGRVGCGVLPDGGLRCWDGYHVLPRQGGLLKMVSLGCDLGLNGDLTCRGWETVPGSFDYVRAQSGFCGLRSDGTAACSGTSFEGGNEKPTGAFVTLDAGGRHACGLRADGTLDCWGNLNDGSLNEVPGTFSAVATGATHVCAIRTNGTLQCFGSNEYGESSPPDGVFHAVSAGNRHSCGIQADAAIRCWGTADYGVLNAPSGAFRLLDTRSRTNCALRLDGTAVCWGISQSFEEESAPAIQFQSVYAGDGYGCGIDSARRLTCWGAQVR